MKTFITIIIAPSSHHHHFVGASSSKPVQWSLPWFRHRVCSDRPPSQGQHSHHHLRQHDRHHSSQQHDGHCRCRTLSSWELEWSSETRWTSAPWPLPRTSTEVSSEKKDRKCFLIVFPQGDKTRTGQCLCRWTRRGKPVQRSLPKNDEILWQPKILIFQ